MDGFDNRTDYIPEPVTFQAVRARRYRRLFRLLAGFTGASWMITLGLATSVIWMLPLVRVVPVFIGFNDDGTRDSHTEFSALPPSQRVAAIEASLWQYVRMRESWNAWDAEYNYDVVSAMSAPNVRDAYQAFANSRDPENPAVKFGKSGSVRVDRLRSGFLPRHAEDYSRGAYTIDFCRVVMIDGAKPQARRMTVSLEYALAEKIPLTDRIRFNPDGVIVVGYPGPTQIGAPRQEASRCE